MRKYECHPKPIQLFFLIIMLVTTSSIVMAKPNDPVVYNIDSSTSEIHWRVYKAGVLAGLGHNHVISVAKPAGQVFLSQVLPELRIEMELSVVELVIDDSTLRARYGEGFASEPSADDIAGTRSNMLSKSLLNGAKFSTIKITGTGLTGYGVDQTIDLAIQLLGREISVSVPANIEPPGNGVIQVQAEFRLTHEQLGLKPFSALFGALQVADEIDFSVRIRAIQPSL